MPELPEVETIRRGLTARLVGQVLRDCAQGPDRLRGRRLDPAQVHDFPVDAVARHGKFLFLQSGRGTVAVHLGMTGKLLFRRRDAPRLPHTHVVFRLDGPEDLHFVDPRRFGSVSWLTGRVGSVPHFGPDALGAGWSEAFLAESLQESRVPLKAFLLDQRRVAGVGNIYACEALWRAGLSPRRLAQHTPRRRVSLLHESVQNVLHEAIGSGGTSFNDYVNTLGDPGTFVANLAVFQREGKPCPACESPVRRIVQAGRSTFYCPGCQR